VNSSHPNHLINESFVNLPASVPSDISDQYQAGKKAEFNAPIVPWKFMAKTLFEGLNEDRRNGVVQISPEQAGFVGSEVNEFAIYDCGSKLKKKEITMKRARKCFEGEPISVKLLIKNPLMTDIFLSSIKLVCRFADA